MDRIDNAARAAIRGALQRLALDRDEALQRAAEARAGIARIRQAVLAGRFYDISDVLGPLTNALCEEHLTDTGAYL